MDSGPMLIDGQPVTLNDPVRMTKADLVGHPPIHRFLDRLFGRAEEINGAHRCETYLYRWVVATFGQSKAYLHRFVGDDWSRDLHDHPKRFWSIGLWGSYLEFTNGSDGFRHTYRRYQAPWIRTFPATHRHRLTTPGGECWTLVIVGKPEREWGFWHDGQFIQWEDYVRGKFSAIADAMKACD